MLRHSVIDGSHHLGHRDSFQAVKPFEVNGPDTRVLSVFGVFGRKDSKLKLRLYATRNVIAPVCQEFFVEPLMSRLWIIRFFQCFCDRNRFLAELAVRADILTCRQFQVGRIVRFALETTYTQGQTVPPHRTATRRLNLLPLRFRSHFR